MTSPRAASHASAGAARTSVAHASVAQASVAQASVAPASDRVRLRRKPERGRYDRASIDAILDEALVGFVGWVIDGQPYVAPITPWRQGDRLYWHASAGSRMVRAANRGEPVCLTVAILDGLVFARSGTNHSMNYRSVMVLGRPHLVEVEQEKAAALDALIDRLAPGRAAGLRPATPDELRKTTVLWVGLDESSAKIRAGGAIDEPDDLDWPAWAGVLPVSLVSGPPEPETGAVGRAPVALGGSSGRPGPRGSATPR